MIEGATGAAAAATGIQPWMIKLAAIGAVIFALFVWHEYSVHVAVHDAVSQAELVHKQAYDALSLKAQKNEIELGNKVNKIKGEKDEAIKAANTKYNALLNSLRDRPTGRQTSGTRSASNGKGPEGATGKELSRPDAEFLAGFASDTESLKNGLNACYKQYDAVKDQLQKFKQ